MKKIMSFLPVLFKTQSARTAAEAQPIQPLPQSILSLFQWKDNFQPVHFSNVLALNVPSESLAAMAFEDYYPAFYFALKRFEDQSRTQIVPAHHNTGPENSGSVLERFYILQEELKASLDVNQDGHVKSFDEHRYMKAIYDHIDILTAMKAAMNAPIGNIKEIRSTALVSMDSPLKKDIVMDRYNSAYANKYLEDFLEFIEWAQANAPQCDHLAAPSTELTDQNSPQSYLP